MCKLRPTAMSARRAPLSRRRASWSLFLTMSALLLPTAAHAQLVARQIDELRARGAAEGWTFTVGENPATAYALEDLCALQPPPGWGDGTPLRIPPVIGALPAAFNWCTLGGCTPVKNQGGCGSCWAFSTLGALECLILIQDGVTENLSEQWLVSCNAYGYDCDGGWFVHPHLLNIPDDCAAIGAVLEADFPYTGTNAPCACPYPRAYTIDDWAYIGTGGTIPPVEDIKQAIYAYGPVSTAMYADATTQAYTGGIYNHCPDAGVNHGVVLVGWDDNQGPGGVWIMRNSWGAGWGEAGYMRIPYGCSRIGYGACYTLYTGAGGAVLEVTPTTLDFDAVAVGASVTADLTVRNTGAGPLIGSATGLEGPFSFVGPASYSLNGGESTTVTVRFAPGLCGASAASILFTGGGGTTIPVSGSGNGNGVPADQCAYAPSITDGAHTASNATATTEISATCGGGTADIWWSFSPPFDGAAAIDTSGSAIDTILSAHSACGGDQLACNDDAPAGGDTSAITLNVTVGQSYLIRVAGMSGQKGNITLHILTERGPLSFGGCVRDGEGDPVPGVLMTGLPGNPDSGADGCYASIVEYGFSSTVTPTLTGLQFDPPSRTYSNLAAAVANANFDAAVATVTIAGRILDDDEAPLANVLLSGLPHTVRTNALGEYQATVDFGFTGNVTPQLGAHQFTPASRMYRSVFADRLNDDYLGQAITGELTVTLLPVEAVDAGAQWRVDGGKWRDTGDTASDLLIGPHQVQAWDVDGWNTPEETTIAVSAGQLAAHELTYTRDGCSVTIRVDPPGSGTVTISPPPDSDGKYTCGSSILISAEPTDGYSLSGWTGDVPTAEAETAQIRIELHSDTNLQANFAATRIAAGQESSPDGDVGGMTCGGCGSGAAGALPLTLLSLGGLKWRLRNRSQRHH